MSNRLCLITLVSIALFLTIFIREINSDDRILVNTGSQLSHNLCRMSKKSLSEFFLNFSLEPLAGGYCRGRSAGNIFGYLDMGYFLV